MTKKEKPLPAPPATPFGRKRRFEGDFEGGKETPLTADRMAEALAQGRLEEFLKQELPDSEYARTLARMMMEMTGMLPPEGSSSAPEKAAAPSEEVASPPASERPAPGKDILDQLSAIAARNNVTVDWIIERALKVYIEEYRKTGRL